MKRGWVCAVLVFLAAAFAACGGGKSQVAGTEAITGTGTAPVDAPSADRILDAAIEAAGGLAKIEAASSRVSRSQGVYMGVPYESKNTYKNGLVRMDIAMAGEPMSMVMAAEPCWMQTGPVVQSCTAEERRMNGAMSAMGEAMRLAPLKRPGWELTARSGEAGGRPADVLAVRNAAVGAAGELYFDPESHTLVEARYEATMHGQEAEVVVALSEYEELCGVRTFSKSVATFGGAPYVEEKIGEMACGPVDDAVFAAPAQVADGTTVEKDVPAMTVACDVMRGPYDGVGAAIGKVMGFMAERGLGPVGAPTLLYVVCPAETKDPAKYVTEVCFPVAAPPPAVPEESGDFVIKGLPATRVLAVYGVGPSEKTSPVMAQRASDEAKKRQLVAAGHMRQISYSDPATVPPDQQVSELQLPIERKK
jgi:effector-binding domain-containing protein